MKVFGLSCLCGQDQWIFLSLGLEVSGLPCLYGKIEELFVLVVSGIKIWREFHNIYDHCMMLSQMNYTIGMRMMMVKTIKSSLSSWIIVSLFKSLSSLCVAQLILSPIFEVLLNRLLFMYPSYQISYLAYLKYKQGGKFANLIQNKER